MLDHPNICREVFISKDLVMTYDQFISLVTNDGKDETDFEKTQSRKFFDNFIVNAATDTIQKLFRFVFGFERLPSWGISGSISVRNMPDGNERSFPRHHVTFPFWIYQPSILPKKLLKNILQTRQKLKELVLVPKHKSCRYSDIFILLSFIFLEKVHVVLLAGNMYCLTHFSLQDRCQVLQALIYIN